MADISSTLPAAPRQNPFVAALTGFVNGLTRIAEANARVRDIEALNALSDAQLAKRGLRRDEIVRYVFRDTAFL